MKLNIVNEHLNFQKVSLVAPTTSYYLHLAAEVDQSLLPIFLTTSSKKKRLIREAKRWCQELEQQAGVNSAVVFTARLIPPGRGKFVQQRQAKAHIAKFDFAVLIETSDLAAIDSVKNSQAYQELEQAVKRGATYIHTITATNVKHIGPVDHQRQGVFLFNYFFADNTEQNLGVWEYTAGWFQQETKLGNSTVLLPLEPEKSKYSIINHCRWNKMIDILPSLLFKKSFRSYVLNIFEANNVAAMPVLYKLA